MKTAPQRVAAGRGFCYSHHMAGNEKIRAKRRKAAEREQKQETKATANEQRVASDEVRAEESGAELTREEWLARREKLRGRLFDRWRHAPVQEFARIVSDYARGAGLGEGDDYRSASAHPERISKLLNSIFGAYDVPYTAMPVAGEPGEPVRTIEAQRDAKIETDDTEVADSSREKITVDLAYGADADEESVFGKPEAQAVEELLREYTNNKYGFDAHGFSDGEEGEDAGQAIGEARADEVINALNSIFADLSIPYEVEWRPLFDSSDNAVQLKAVPRAEAGLDEAV